MNGPAMVAGATEPGPIVRFDRLLDAVYPRLNALHGTDRSRRFWEILLYRYLWKCMIVDAAGMPPREAPTAVSSDEAVLGPRVGDDGKRRLQGGRGRRALIAARQRLAAMPQTPTAFRERTRLRRLWRTPVGSSRSVLAGFHYFHVIADLVDPPVSWLNPRALRVEVAGDPSRRAALRDSATVADGPLARLALEWLPCWYVEEFRERDAAVRVLDPERRQFHASFLSSVESQFQIARHVEAGARLSIYQHAAMYGELDQHVLHHAESAFADRFCTWGWTLAPNDVPFLALRLMKPAGQEIRPRAGASRWLYVNVRQPFPWLVPHTLDVQDRLFSALGEAEARKIVIRPRVNKGGAPHRQVSDIARRRAFGIDDGTATWTRLANQAELVILDAFPTTVFMECMAAALPVIAVVPESTVFTGLAARFYDRFFEIGVLHRTPESAGRFLSGLSVRAWWASVQAEACLPEFLRTFCRTTDPRASARR